MILLNSRKFEETYKERLRRMEEKKIDKVEKLFEDYRAKRRKNVL